MVIRLPTFDDKYVKNQFVWLQRPVFWWRMARDLAESAEAVLRTHDRTIRDQKRGRRYRRMIMPGIWQELFNPINYQPAYLLYALAIENALKGILVGRNNDLITPERLTKIITSTRLSTPE